jgi:hypothetical protein
LLALSGAFGAIGGSPSGFGGFEPKPEITRNINALTIIVDLETMVFRRISAQICAKSVAILPRGWTLKIFLNSPTPRC